MNLRRAFLFGIASLLVAGTAGVAAQTMMPAQREALNAAERWLVPVDAERYADAWAMASESFKAKVGREEWRDGIRAIRKDYGRVVTRQGEKMAFVGEAPKADDPGGPGKVGMQVAILFDTKFVRDRQATEEIMMVLEKDGLWRVAGYHIR